MKLRSAGAEKYLAIAFGHKHQHRSSIKREGKLEELRGHSTKSSSEEDNDLLNSDVFFSRY